MPISKNGNYYCLGAKKNYRFSLVEKKSNQASFLFYKLKGKQSEGYIWLTQDSIRHLQKLLDLNRSDTLYLSSRFFKMKIQKVDTNEVQMVLRDKQSRFLDYFWLKTDEIIALLRILFRILPKKS
jgi:hypothetical protein